MKPLLVIATLFTVGACTLAEPENRNFTFRGEIPIDGALIYNQ